MSDTFCALAWTTLGMSPKGRVRVCGYSEPNQRNLNLKDVSVESAWNSEYYRKLRLDMLAGRRNSNCERCYMEERWGGKSKRLQTNENWNMTKESAGSLTDNEGYVHISPRHIDIRVGNICNLKCVHCWTTTSSKWNEDKLLLGKYENTPKIQNDNYWISDKRRGGVWDYAKTHIHKLREMSFLGGEPFADRSHGRFLKWLIENRHTHLILNYVTNGTLLTRDIVKKLEKMKSVRLNVSVDDIGERAEFLRYPTKWKQLESNLFLLKSAGFETRFQWTAYNANIFRLPETYRYCLENFPEIKFLLCNFVTSPAHMSIQNLPVLFKRKVTEKLQKFKLLNTEVYLKFMNEKHTWNQYNQTLYNYLEDLDCVRKTNWRMILPEIANLYGCEAASE